MNKIFLILFLLIEFCFGQNKVQKIGEVGDTLDVTNTKIKYNTNEISAFLSKITSGSQLQSSGIQDGAITAGKIGTNAVTSDKIYYGAVDGLRIATNAVSTTHIVANSVTSAKMKFDDGPIIDVVACGVPNDSTDAYMTLQALLNAATSGSVFYFPPGRYRTSAELTFTRAAHHDSITLEFAPGAEWYPDGNGFYATGVITGNSTTLSSDVPANYEQITLADPHAFKIGNILSFLSTASWPFGTGVRKGEINVFLGNQGDVTRLWGNTWGEYDVPGETVTVTEYTPVTVTIKDATMIFNSASGATAYGIRYVWGKNCIVQNCRIYRALYEAIEYRNCIGGMVMGNEIGSSNKTGGGYGVGLISSNNVDVSHNRVYECRTAFTASAGTTNYPARNNSFVNNFVFSSGWLRPDSSNIWDGSGGATAFDSHEGSEWNIYDHNYIFGSYIGFKLRGLYNIVRDNDATGYMYAYASVSGGAGLKFTGNIYSSRLQSKGGMTSPDEMTYQIYYPILFGASATSGTKSFWDISDNTIDGILIAGITVSSDFENLNVVGNHFTFNRTAGNNVYFLYTAGATSRTISNSRFLDNIIHTISGTFSYTYAAKITLTNCISTYTDYSSGQFYILGTLSPTVLNMPTLTLSSIQPLTADTLQIRSENGNGLCLKIKNVGSTGYHSAGVALVSNNTARGAGIMAFQGSRTWYSGTAYTGTTYGDRYYSIGFSKGTTLNQSSAHIDSSIIRLSYDRLVGINKTPAAGNALDVKGTTNLDTLVTNYKIRAQGRLEIPSGTSLPTTDLHVGNLYYTEIGADHYLYIYTGTHWVRALVTAP